MAFMVLTNITSIWRLGKQAVITLDDYLKQKRAGIKEPVFDRSILPNQEGVVWWHKDAK